jgi:hypothetical protein
MATDENTPLRRRRRRRRKEDEERLRRTFARFEHLIKTNRPSICTYPGAAWRKLVSAHALLTSSRCRCCCSPKGTRSVYIRTGAHTHTILRLFLFLTSLTTWRCETFSSTILRLPHHIPLIAAPSLRWSLAMGLIYSKTIIYFSSLRQI